MQGWGHPRQGPGAGGSRPPTRDEDRPDVPAGGRRMGGWQTAPGRAVPGPSPGPDPGPTASTDRAPVCGDGTADGRRRGARSWPLLTWSMPPLSGAPTDDDEPELVRPDLRRAGGRGLPGARGPARLRRGPPRAGLVGVLRAAPG